MGDATSGPTGADGPADRGPRGAGWAAGVAGLAVLLAAAGWLAAELPGVWTAAGPPSVVLVVWDTCRGDRVSVNGYGPATTPHLGEFAARGITWTNCFTPSPWTPPAHASLFTGLIPRRHGLVEGVRDRMRGGIPTLAETLREAGYETVCVTANSLVSRVTGLDAGFESYLPAYRDAAQDVGAEAVRDRVREWIARRKAAGGRRPFFLFVNLMATHLPYEFEDPALAALHGASAVGPARGAVETVGDIEAKSVTLGQMAFPPATIEALGRAYDGSVRKVDGTTAEILADLREAGLLDGAFAAVTADHGENLGEHGELNHVFSVYDPVLHVPLVVHWPGRFEGGRTVDAQVRLQDLYPTILQAAGVPVPAGCGQDAAILDPAGGAPRVAVAEYGPMFLSLPEVRDALPGFPEEAFERFHWRYSAVRAPGPGPRSLKFIEVRRAAPGMDGGLVRESLYDLAADPGEEHDLLGASPTPEDRAAADALRSLLPGRP